MQELTYEFLNEILEYAPETGKFFWKKPVAKNIAARGLASLAEGAYHV